MKCHLEDNNHRQGGDAWDQFSRLVVQFALRFLWITRSTFGFAKRTDRSVAMNLLMTGKAVLHWRWLLSKSRSWRKRWVAHPGADSGGMSRLGLRLQKPGDWDNWNSGQWSCGRGQVLWKDLLGKIKRWLEFHLLFLKQSEDKFLISFGHLVRYWIQAKIRPHPVNLVLHHHLLLVNLLCMLQCLVSFFICLLYCCFHQIDVSMNEPQFLHVSHSLLLKQFHFSFVFLQAFLLIFDRSDFGTQSLLQLLQMCSPGTRLNRKTHHYS